MMPQVRIGALQDVSSAMGPGKRAVIWVRGCSIRCPGCITPEFFESDTVQDVSVEDVCTWLTQIKAQHNIEGVSFSGGEPFEQAEVLSQIAAHAQAIGLSTLAWSGYTLQRLSLAHAPCGTKAFLSQLDVLIDGPYLRQRATTLPLRGSSNQSLHLLTTRYTLADFTDRFMELVISPNDLHLVGVGDHARLRAAFALSGLLGGVT